MTIENRLIDLEIKLAYQEDAVQQLNDVVLRQQRQIELLERICLQLQERVRAIGDGATTTTASPADEVPPHY